MGLGTGELDDLLGLWQQKCFELRRTGSAAAIAVAISRGYGLPIGCLLVLFAFISPRLALFALWLFSDLLGRAFDSWFVPFLGFFLLPWTTLAYAVMWSSADRVAGFEWFIVVLAFCFDLGSYASRDRARRANA
jgi:hypothetical protein